jgi:hypothetical protein
MFLKILQNLETGEMCLKILQTLKQERCV